jgi:hypothetical protein
MVVFAQNPPWKKENEMSIAISARADLDVRWEARNKFPRKVWSYQLLPNNFSPKIISNVMTLCSFTEKDTVEDDTNGIIFQSADRSRTLSISFSSGEIKYKTPEIRYSPTQLAVGVPLTNQLSEVAKNVLSKLHISFSDITGWIGTHKIDFSEPLTIFFVGDTAITNISYRTVYFRRCVDGMPIDREFYGFNVGEHGRISKLSITWPKLRRIKSYRAILQKDVIDLLRKGDAIRGPVPTNIGDFDWQDVKSMTITRAIPSYMVNGGQLYPFLRMDVTIDMGGQNVRLAIDSPIIDESKL